MKQTLILLFLFFALSLQAEYVRPAHVDPDIWNKMAPHFLPFDHPLKRKLDRLFLTRVTKNSKSLATAGFKQPGERSFSHIVVSKHPKIKGYVLKLYTDEYTKEETDLLLHRVLGSKMIKKAIKQHGYSNWFEVPKKWIYPLPENPAPPDNCLRKNFILIAEEMNILSKKHNLLWWQSPYMTKERLQAIYTLVQELGLDDSVLPANLCFLQGGKQAFVDTEIFHRWPIRYYLLIPSLSHPMKKYWSQLFQNGDFDTP